MYIVQTKQIPKDQQSLVEFLTSDSQKHWINRIKFKDYSEADAHCLKCIEARHIEADEIRIVKVITRYKSTVSVTREGGEA